VPFGGRQKCFLAGLPSTVAARPSLLSQLRHRDLAAAGAAATEEATEQSPTCDPFTVLRRYSTRRGDIHVAHTKWGPDCIGIAERESRKAEVHTRKSPCSQLSELSDHRRRSPVRGLLTPFARAALVGAASQNRRLARHQPLRRINNIVRPTNEAARYLGLHMSWPECTATVSTLPVRVWSPLT
jgi:hypothetical protein